MGDVPEQVFIDAARAWVTTVDGLDGQRWADLPLVIPDNPALRAAVASAYRAGQAATPDGPRRWALPDDRAQAKAAIHRPLHDLNVRIVGLAVGDCHCNLIAEVVLDALTDATPAADGQDGDGRG